MPESKYGKCIVTEDLMPLQPAEWIQSIEDQAKEGKILDRTICRNNYIERNAA
jgi:hypothetical protein